MPQPGDPASLDFLSQEPSFSLIYFDAPVVQHLPSLLKDCGYRVIEQQQDQRRSFADLLDMIARSPSRTIVYKAAFPVSNGAVVVDPEMVLFLNGAAAIRKFCQRYRAAANVAIWERFSETVIAQRLTATGIDMDFMSIDGQPPQKRVNAPPDLVRWPGPDRLREFLAADGAPLNEIFGIVSAQVFKLDEGPPPH